MWQGQEPLRFREALPALAAVSPAPALPRLHRAAPSVSSPASSMTAAIGPRTPDLVTFLSPASARTLFPWSSAPRFQGPRCGSVHRERPQPDQMCCPQVAGPHMGTGVWAVSQLRAPVTPCMERA